MYGTKDGLIFLIDATLNMFAGKVGDDTYPFELAIKVRVQVPLWKFGHLFISLNKVLLLKCAVNAIKTKIISTKTDAIGVVLLGTVRIYVYILYLCCQQLPVFIHDILLSSVGEG